MSLNITHFQVIQRVAEHNEVDLSMSAPLGSVAFTPSYRFRRALQRWVAIPVLILLTYEICVFVYIDGCPVHKGQNV